MFNNLNTVQNLCDDSIEPLLHKYDKEELIPNEMMNESIQSCVREVRTRKIYT
jgi:hypothetical protein